MKWTSLVVALALVSASVHAQHTTQKGPALPGLTQQDSHIPNEELIFNALGFDGAFSRAKLRNLENYIKREQSLYESEAEKSTDKVIVKIAGVNEKILKHAERAMEELDAELAFNLGRRLVSAALINDKDRVLAKYPDAGKAVAAKDNRVPMTAEEQARLEGTIAQLMMSFGADPSKVKLEQLVASMGIPAPAVPVFAEKIRVRLQRFIVPESSVVIPVAGQADETPVGKHHPVRVTEKNYPSSAKKAWKALEDFWTERVKQDTGKDYGLKSSRSVLFFEGMDDSATSPKFEAKDAWGRKLKVKSGDEVQSEVVANRLWMALGGKYTDLTYNVKGEELIIILPQNVADISAEAAQKRMNHRQALEYSMIMSGYQYRLANNIYSGGTVTKELFETFPKKVREQLKYKDVQGRAYVRLKEAALEFKPKEGIVFGGGAAFSSDLAKYDSIGKTSVLFNLWIGNRDAKDDNNRSVVLKFSKGDKNELNGVPVLRNKEGKGSAYVEYQSDLGNSLGDMFSAGDLQKLKGEDFLALRKEADGSLSIRPAEPLLYVPGAWNHVTAPELTKEAGNIAHLMKPLLLGERVEFEATDLGWILGQTNWPKFMQLAMANRLSERARGILKTLNTVQLRVYGRDGREIGYPMTRPFEPDWTLTEENLEEFARETDLSVKVLKPFLGVQMLAKGKLTIADPRAAQLMELLEIERYPSGLYHRVSRTRDHKPKLYGTPVVPAGLQDIFKRPKAEELLQQEEELKKTQPRTINNGRPKVQNFASCEQLLKRRKK